MPTCYQKGSLVKKSCRRLCCDSFRQHSGICSTSFWSL